MSDDDVVDWSQRLLRACQEVGGFEAAGIVDAGPQIDDPKSYFNQCVLKYVQWIQNGHAGQMQYLIRGRDRRANPRLVFPEVQSILCVVMKYPSQVLGTANPDEGVRMARYIRGGDYHLVIQEKLDRVLKSMNDSDLQWKICVDTSAVLERTWAALCGLGWIGKNAMLIHPQLGSYTLIGTVLLNRLSGHQARLLPDYCGNCARCLTACPTQAFSGARNLDSRKCISYLTLEKRGEPDLKAEPWEKVGNWVAGCDLCQEVCPFNQKSAKIELGLSPNSELKWKWDELLSESELEYRDRVKATALSRIKPSDFKRNLMLAQQSKEDQKT